MAHWLYQGQTEPILPPQAAPTIFPDRWINEWRPPRRRQVAIALLAAATVLPPVQPAPQAATIGWFAPFSQPKKTKPQTPSWIAFAPLPIAQQGWYQPFSAPVRAKKPLPILGGFFYDAKPTVPFGWQAPLSLPVRTKVRATFSQPAFVDPVPKVSFSWFGAISEPARKKKGLIAAYHPVTVFDLNPGRSPWGWFDWLSEPVRLPNGLKVYLQRSYTSPDRVLPRVTVVTVFATESPNDIFTGAVNVFRQALRAKVSIEEIPASGTSPWSIREP